MNNFRVENILGVLAVFCYILTLLPTIIRVVFPSLRKNIVPIQLLKYRRQIGVLSFLLILGHVYPLIRKLNFDFLDPKTYLVYVHGSATFLIFTLLTITSNDWSVKKLKKNWKRLHQLTYCAMFLLCWHILGAMAGHITWQTLLSASAMVVTIVLFLIRRWIEWKRQHIKKEAVAEPKQICG